MVQASKISDSANFKQMLDILNNQPFMQAKLLNLNQYFTNEALGGLFIMMGKEKNEIRTYPTTRATDLLKINFCIIASRNLT